MRFLSKYFGVVLLTFLVSYLSAQTDSVIWNGQVLHIPDEKDTSAINEISDLGSFVIHWYNLGGERFGRCYSYFDKERKHINCKAIIKDRPDLPHRTNWAFVGAVTYFYKSGNVRSQQDYRSDLRNGLYTYYFPNGQLKISGYYRAGKPIDTWETYNSKGKKIREKYIPYFDYKR
jgi:hypothetical protein